MGGTHYMWYVVGYPTLTIDNDNPLPLSRYNTVQYTIKYNNPLTYEPVSTIVPILNSLPFLHLTLRGSRSYYDRLRLYCLISLLRLAYSTFT